MHTDTDPLELARQIDAAHAAHLTWKRRFFGEITLGHRAISPSEIAETGKCTFGAWLASAAFEDRAQRTEPYHLAAWLHAEIHSLAGEVVTLARDGRKFDATHLMNGELAGISGVLTHVLDEWKAEVAGLGTARLFGS